MTPSQYQQRLTRLELEAQRRPPDLHSMSDAAICRAFGWPLDITDDELREIIAKGSTWA